ncbi:MAG: M48 family metallopeptidase [Gammaproteobacteria bacterium]|nr:M48 family metallopeptidase [Gammaproteobacteria bacterium]MBU1416382.1 M48 family metallopeptidase [Gammaproteobacteria bacterium]
MGTRTKRKPQLALRLDAAAPDVAARWRDGASLACLGATVTLRLDTACKEAMFADGQLHLPLPPEATPRQIQDAAESWLRAYAVRVISAQVVMAARPLRRAPPAVSLSFAARGSWAQPHDRGLRFHWRLIEQPPEVIAQVVERAVAALPKVEDSLDLFALA